MCHMFISTFDATVPSLYKGAKDGEIIGIIVENKHINGLEIDLECVIVTFNQGFSMFNVCCCLSQFY